MLIAEKNHRLIYADGLDKKIKGLRCPGCHQEVVFRHGNKRISHFAHRNADLCGFSEGETAEHLLGKKQLYNWAKRMGWNPQLELYLSRINQRPDLLLTINKRKIAIEFQCSPLSLTRLLERNAGYHKEKIKVLWLLGAPYKRKLGSKKIAQFTEVFRGQPYLLFWNTKTKKIERKTYYRCSYTKNKFNKQRILGDQIKHLLKEQFNNPSDQIKLLSVNAAKVGHQWLAGCPLVCHDLVPTWPALSLPVIIWRITVILKLEDYPLFISWTVDEWFNLLHKCGENDWLENGCVQSSLFQSQQISQLTNDLIAAGIIVESLNQLIFIRRPKWFQVISEKRSLLTIETFR